MVDLGGLPYLLSLSLTQIRMAKVFSILCIPRVSVYKPLYRKLTQYEDHMWLDPQRSLIVLKLL